MAEREHALLSRLFGPHFPCALGTSRGGGWTICDMELVDGYPLSDTSRLLAATTLDGMRALVRGCLEILDALAGAGIVHRDIKADNILVRKDGRPVLIDFGWATAPDLPHVTPAGLGNDGRPADGFCDTYSMGVALGEACARHPELLPVLEAITRAGRDDRVADTRALRELLDAPPRPDEITAAAARFALGRIAAGRAELAAAALEHAKALAPSRAEIAEAEGMLARPQAPPVAPSTPAAGPGTAGRQGARLRRRAPLAARAARRVHGRLRPGRARSARRVRPGRGGRRDRAAPRSRPGTLRRRRPRRRPAPRAPGRRLRANDRRRRRAAALGQPGRGAFSELPRVAGGESIRLRDAVGVAGSRLLYPDRTIQHAGIVWNEQGRLAHMHRGAPAEAPADLDRRDFGAVTGACLLIRRDLFFEVGAFDPGHHMYVEDVDLCIRVWESGHRVTYCPGSVVVHLENPSMTDVAWRDRNIVAGWQRLNERWAGRWPRPCASSPGRSCCRAGLDISPCCRSRTTCSRTPSWSPGGAGPLPGTRRRRS